MTTHPSLNLTTSPFSPQLDPLSTFPLDIVGIMMEMYVFDNPSVNRWEWYQWCGEWYSSAIWARRRWLTLRLVSKQWLDAAMHSFSESQIRLLWAKSIRCTLTNNTWVLYTNEAYFPSPNIADRLTMSRYYLKQGINAAIVNASRSLKTSENSSKEAQENLSSIGSSLNKASLDLAQYETEAEEVNRQMDALRSQLASLTKRLVHTDKMVFYLRAEQDHLVSRKQKWEGRFESAEIGTGYWKKMMKKRPNFLPTINTIPAPKPK